MGGARRPSGPPPGWARPLLAALALAGALAAAAAVASSAPPPGPGSAPGPRLAVLVVVDQLPVRLLEAARPHLAGGLARLAGDGAFRTTARYAHACTLTGPGHATLATGASPAVHGIVGNAWYEGSVRISAGEPGRLRGEALADRVRARGGRVASLSLKDRGAVLLGGRAPDVAVWFDARTGTLVGAGGWKGEGALADHRARPWTALMPELYARTRGPDDAAHEADWQGLGRTFPHPATRDLSARAFMATPAAGSLLTDLAVEAVERLRLGQTGSADLLTLSYSHVDLAGHAFTPESWESIDALLRLDADLGRLFEALDGRLGRSGYAVVLTSDHGAPPALHAWVDGADLALRASRALREAGIDGDVDFAVPGLWLPSQIPAERRSEAVRAVRAVAAATANVHAALVLPPPGGPVAPESTLDALVGACASPGRSPDVYVVPSEGASFFDEEIPHQGTQHGAPWAADTDVPLLAFGAGIRSGAPGGLADPRQVAPTLGRLLGVGAPAQAERGVLDAALAAP